MNKQFYLAKSIHKEKKVKGKYSLKSYEIKEMIIDDDFYGEEYVTVDFEHEDKNYSITFHKGDLELLNTWVFENETSLPAHLSNHLIDSIREEIREKI
jgi:hypothetical protein